MQFTMRWLLAIILFAAILCSLFFAAPDMIGSGLLCVLALTVAPFTVALIVYGKGGVRAFGIGSSVASLSAMGAFGGGEATFATVIVQFTFQTLEDTLKPAGWSVPGVMKSWVALYLGGVALCGMVAVAVRWLCLPFSQLNPRTLNE
jgi:hypothetical protein